MLKRTIRAIFLVICFVSGLAYGQTPFFQGKTITIVVGYQAGDGYDIWSRLLAAHMGKHIPGKPGLIAQNMPGAGSMIAANHIFNVAKADGLTIGSIGPSLYLDQLVGKKEVQFDWSKFGWVGSTESTPWLLYMSSNTPYKSIDDVRKAKEPPKCSATGTGTSGHFIPKLLEDALGAKFNVVMGYQGGAEQDLAFERGEVVCRSLSIPTFFAREPFITWRKKNMTPRDFRIGYVDPFFVHPQDPNLLFVAGAKTGPGTWRNLHTADARIARSRDGGKTWEMLTGGLPEHIRANIEGMAMDVWNGGYAIFAGTTDGDVFYSEDGGEHWQTIIKGIGPVSKSHHYHNLALDEQEAHH